LKASSNLSPQPAVKRRTLTRTILAKFGDSAFVAVQKRFLKMSVDKVERSGRRLGHLHYLIDSKHRERTLSNLRMIYPDWSEREIKQVGRSVFEHFGRTAADFMRSPTRSDQETLNSVVEVEGIEYLRQAQEMGGGILLVTAHFGNWERFLQWLTASGVNITVITRPANQKGIEQRIISMREHSGAKVLARGNSARQALVCLRRKETVGLLIDQNHQDAFVPFFGFPAGTALGPAVMHLRTQAALLPAYCVWVGPGKYKVCFRPLVDPENLIEDRVEIMSALNDAIESGIRDYPDQWLWMHDRWKNARKAGLLDNVPSVLGK
jgi:KDO2-lipid IV(A) lauroyltransferase